ncbi:MAG: UDP-3-O-(3-hydroxymyristoyl) glucosamine N-acyltransferase [Acidobacteria bacterium OLB17]|nr:MAG: UDP-3-O-(3-hydroxymyristoyl) glucosamine N-acyltransferase [Acidobacteria bacterium OLB17]
MKLSELAKIADSTIESGEPTLEIVSAAGLDLAQKGEVTFLANPKYTSQVAATNASAIFLATDTAIERGDIAVLRAKDPYLAYTKALRAFFPEPALTPFVHSSAVIDPTASVDPETEIHANAVIGPNAVIEKGVRILPNVTIYENVRVGEGTTIHSGVSVRENCEIGRRCTIHNNTTIGSDGFGYAKTPEKSWLKIPQPAVSSLRTMSRSERTPRSTVLLSERRGSDAEQRSTTSSRSGIHVRSMRTH